MHLSCREKTQIGTFKGFHHLALLRGTNRHQTWNLMLCPLDLWILEIWAHSLWFVSKQRLEPSRNIGICGYTSLESPRNKIMGKKLQMTARLGSSAHTKMLIYIQGWSCFCYVCIKKHEIKKKKRIFTLCNHAGVWCVCARASVCICVWAICVCTSGTGLLGMQP